MNEPEILFTTLAGSHGNIGLVTLNRPQLLNALSQNMCVLMSAQLSQWAQEDVIKAVVICGSGDKAFCAGGDIRNIYEFRQETATGRAFFLQEYRLNQQIFHFPKPYIALLDGLVMGGGAGLSVNGSFRVATEKLKFAMPETGIGFFPDVGGSYFLPRCQGRTGWYLALTGHIINVSDAHYAGLITHHLPSKQLPALLNALVEESWKNNLFETVAAVIEQFEAPVFPDDLVMHREIIDRCFSKDNISAVIEALMWENNPWTQETVQCLLKRSPTSLKVTFEQLTRGGKMEFDDCMRMEYNIALHFLNTYDFYEGVRAAVIEKDRNPHWQPSTLAEMTNEMVAAFFIEDPQHKFLKSLVRN